jgi:excinuclease ABC subunit C
MLDAEGEILYVGKARNLRAGSARTSSPATCSPRSGADRQDRRMEVTITNSDTEALLLELNLIKKHRPRFNVILRDDKSFPFLHLTTGHEFPR